MIYILFIIYELVIIFTNGFPVVPCFDRGEVYASCWIATKNLVLENKLFATTNYSYANGEASTFYLIASNPKARWWNSRNKFNSIKKNNNALLSTGGIPVHSRFFLDFAAIHLSSLEKYASHIPFTAQRKSTRISEIQSLVSPVLKNLEIEAKEKNFISSDSLDTLIMIPFFNQVKWRTGESFLENRPLYLKATIKMRMSLMERCQLEFRICTTSLILERRF